MLIVKKSVSLVNLNPLPAKAESYCFEWGDDMGLFGKSKVSQGEKPDWMVGFIRVFAANYYIIRNTDYGRILYDSERIYAAGLLSAMPFLRSGIITPDDLQKDLDLSFPNDLSDPDLKMVSTSDDDLSEIARALDFAEIISKRIYRIKAYATEHAATYKAVSILDTTHSDFARILELGIESTYVHECIQESTSILNDSLFRYLVNSFTKFDAMSSYIAELEDDLYGVD